jgi:DNA-binding NtrC family response regulator
MVCRVLILEDEVMIADLVEGMVRELGYEVSATAHNREAALEAIDKNDFDLALVDMSMDGKECPELPDRLIELNRPFAFMTGHERPREARHSDIQIVRKPFKHEDLQNVLADLSRSLAVRDFLGVIPSDLSH